MFDLISYVKVGLELINNLCKVIPFFHTVELEAFQLRPIEIYIRVRTISHIACFNSERFIFLTTTIQTKAGFPLTRFSMGAVSRAPFVNPAVRSKTASMETQP